MQDAGMSDIVQIVTLIVGMVTTCFTAYLAYRLNVTAKKVESVSDTVQVVAKQTDGMSKALAKTSAQAGFAAGAASEQAKAQALPDAIREAVAGGIAEERARNGPVITERNEPCP